MFGGIVMNRLKEMGETASWRLMVSAAIEGAKQNGYAAKRQPGRGLSNTWELTKSGTTKIASVRTTRNRWIAFQPLENGARWKTLDDVDLVLVSAVDDAEDPQNVDVYLFPANIVRERFDAAYKARSDAGHNVPDNYGMWVKLDARDPDVVTQVGAGLVDDYPAIARFSIDELEGGVSPATQKDVGEATVGPDDDTDGGPAVRTVAEVLTWARSEIARLSGMPSDAIKLDLKIEA
jgi:hypothetical protein